MTRASKVLRELQEKQEEGWYVFNDNNEIASGPYKSKKEAEKDRDAYNPDDAVGYGIGDKGGFFSSKKEPK